ncbi:MAG: flagellar export protein FliJ [Hydrogenophaga sp.]|nr:flagellar export protein FliJ [Hydrogenophaga sp.]
MSNIQTLNKVVELAEKRRDEALSALGQLQRERQVASEQMQQLQTYANEAQQRWNVRCTSTGVDAALLHHHRQFMQKIDHAMEFQRGVLAQRDELIERGQAQVYAAERDVAGLRKYTERKLDALNLRALRQEQKSTDEMALTIHLRHRLAQSQGLRS